MKNLLSVTYLTRNKFLQALKLAADKTQKLKPKSKFLPDPGAARRWPIPDHESQKTEAAKLKKEKPKVHLEAHHARDKAGGGWGAWRQWPVKRYRRSTFSVSHSWADGHIRFLY